MPVRLSFNLSVICILLFKTIKEINCDVRKHSNSGHVADECESLVGIAL